MKEKATTDKKLVFTGTLQWTGPWNLEKYCNGYESPIIILQLFVVGSRDGP